MKTPSMVSPAEAKRLCDEFMENMCGHTSDGVAVCRECHSNIEMQSVNFSIHYEEFGCGGAGEVMQRGIPFCPKCEETPKDSGCLHVNLFVYPKFSIRAKIKALLGLGDTGG